MRRWLMLAWLAVMVSFTLPAPVHAQESEDSDRTFRRSRVPDQGRSLVRRKFFYKGRRLEITPQFGFVTNSFFQRDFTLGASVAYHFNERLALEFNGAYAFLGGASNQKSLAAAVLFLLERDDDFRLEATDPGLFATLNLMWSPLYGKINPFGMTVVNLDLYFVLGGGYGFEQVELLQFDETLATNGIPENTFTNHLWLANLAVGMKIFVTRSFALRFEGRFYLTVDNVLDFSDTTNAQANRRLPTDASRLSCHGNSQFFYEEARCVPTAINTFIFTIGGSIFTGRPRVDE